MIILIMNEYLNSNKYQFDFMKDVVKIIYYLVFAHDFEPSNAIKLLRYNSLYGKI